MVDYLKVGKLLYFVDKSLIEKQIFKRATPTKLNQGSAAGNPKKIMHKKSPKAFAMGLFNKTIKVN